MKNTPFVLLKTSCLLLFFGMTFLNVWAAEIVEKKTTAVAAVKKIPQPLSPKLLSEGWIRLFEGTSLYGWKINENSSWKVSDGKILGQATKPALTSSSIINTTKFPESEFFLEYVASTNAEAAVTFGESQDTTRREKIALLIGDGKPHRLVFRLSEKVQLQKKAAVQGYLGLLCNSGTVTFSEIRVRPLRVKSMFNGQDLTGWNTKMRFESRYEVTDKRELRVLSGRGQIETDQFYGDFVMQTECYVDGKDLNSGIFFRCIPGDKMMGYECQIHNGMQKNDPTKAANCGTGGFFRRQDARLIMAKDKEWFHLTLVVQGPVMTAWVNGVQVSYWTDTRKPNENPRRGLRTAPGSICLQGHDPTTDFRFKNMKIVKFPQK